MTSAALLTDTAAARPGLADPHLRAWRCGQRSGSPGHRPMARWLLGLVIAVLTACGGGGGGGGGVPAEGSGSGNPATPPAPGASVTITGTARFDAVPTRANGRGLDYAAVVQRPIRGANVELLAADGTVLASTVTDEQGRYTVTVANAQALRVRVRAEIKRSSASTGDRDFSVRDNTSGNALYVLDSASFTPVAATTTQDLYAASGWNGSRYADTRAAGPFAILDVVYAAQAKIASVAPSVNLPPLTLYWSPNNQPAEGDPSVGDIGTSFFVLRSGARQLYLLGKENTDTDEYDSHVVAHEFGHYLQSALSRDDSMGGPHSTGEQLDMRLAFSEGWGNAWSGMALGSPVYSDSLGSGQASGFAINVSLAPTSNRGWYSESSAQYLLWSAHENSAIGFGPIYTALRSLAQAPTFTSLYSFADALKRAAPAEADGITAAWAAQQIVAQDALGSGETNDGGNPANLPIYKTYGALGTPQTLCVDTRADPDNDGNKLGRHVYVLVTASGPRSIAATRSGGSFAGASDPDLVLIRADGRSVYAQSGASNTETLSATLPDGTQAVGLEDFKLTSPDNSCFNFTVN